MADTKVSLLTSAGPFSDSDIFYVVQSGVSYKTTYGALKAALNSATFPEVANYAALPAAASASGMIYAVLAAQGTYFINRKAAGFYYSDGASWSFLGPIPESYFVDSVLTISDDSDATKQARFQLSSITTGTVRVMTVPDKDGTIAYLSDIDIAALTHAATTKATPVDNDEVPLADSAASYGLKKLTWANTKTTLKAYFDTLYATATHASQHKSGGSDSIKLDELAAPTDVTTLNASTTAHGLLRKLSNVTTDFLRGDGTWASPSADPASFITALRTKPYIYTDFLRLDQALTGEFYSAAISSGTINASSRVSADHPGVVMLKSAGANSGYFLGTRHTASTTSAVFVIAGSENIEIIFNLDTLTAATFRMGFGGASNTSDFANGAYLEINSSGVCTGKTAAASSRSSTGTTYTASTNTWYRLLISFNSGGTTVTYTLYNMSGTSLWSDSLSTNIPTNAVGLCVTAWESVGASQNLIHLDWLAMWYGRTLTR